MLHDICVSKTGTLTMGKLVVYSCQLGDNFKAQKVTNDFFVFGDQKVKDLIKETIISNTDVRIEMNNKTFKYEPHGQALEVGFIQFLIDSNEDVPEEFKKRNIKTPIYFKIPFDQYEKRKVIIRNIKNDRSMMRVYIKGAPEYVIPLCDKTLDLFG